MSDIGKNEAIKELEAEIVQLKAAMGAPKSDLVSEIKDKDSEIARLEDDVQLLQSRYDDLALQKDTIAAAWKEVVLQKLSVKLLCRLWCAILRVGYCSFWCCFGVLLFLQ